MHACAGSAEGTLLMNMSQGQSGGEEESHWTHICHEVQPTCSHSLTATTSHILLGPIWAPWECFYFSTPLVCIKCLYFTCMTFYFNFFNWRIIALQCCVGFCHTTMWISHKYTHIAPPSWAWLSPSHPTPLGCHRSPGWVPCVMQQLPSSYLFHMR